jgi:membrane dipeptidase
MMVAEMRPILDGHNDTLLHLYLLERGGSRTIFTCSDLGHIDLPRARGGGFAGGLFAVFVPSDPAALQGDEADVMRTATGYEVRMAPAVAYVYAQRMTIAVTASLFRLAAESRGQVQVWSGHLGVDCSLSLSDHMPVVLNVVRQLCQPG